MKLSELFHIDFDAMEYQSDLTFKKVSYSYQGSENSGWKIFRKDNLHLELPAGYRLLKTIACGICSTDIARADLPFELPQVTGHEIVALDGDVPVVIDINASHHARGEITECYYCNNGLANHCPERLTLGIDRLPGGFSPYVLVPKNSIYPLPKEIDVDLGVITEPLAAAIRAVEKTPLNNSRSVAVVGPRRLGSLLLFVLHNFRMKQKLNFTLTAIIRNPDNEKLCFAAGADEVLFSNRLGSRSFDTVFDTSGSNSGLELSLAIAKKYIHLKSTNGKSYDGLDVLTELVISEIDVCPINKDELKNLLNSNAEVLVDQRIKIDDSWSLKKHKTFLSGIEPIPSAENSTELFDAVILVDINDLNILLSTEKEKRRIMPEGKVYLYSVNVLNHENKIQQMLCTRHITLLTSRCGSFSKAIQFILQNLSNIEEFKKHFLTHSFELDDINKGFDSVRGSIDCVKAVIRH